MSTTTLSDYKKLPLRRDNSGELDVFEATRYFSDYNDNCALMGANAEMVIKEERQGYFRQGRASLDMAPLQDLQQQQQQHYYKQYHQNYTIAQLEQHRQKRRNNQNQQQQQQQQMNEKKKYKQPSSPGGKLAHFLNSLFNQTIMYSKKKKQPKTTQSMKDEDESPSGRRQRRNSISHFRSTSSTIDAKSLYSSSSSGFRTPPPYTINTPTQSCQNVKTFSDYKQVLATLSKYKIHENRHASVKDDQIRATKFGGMDEEIIKMKNGFVEKPKNYNHGNNNNNNKEKNRETKKNDEELDDGAESDASSDLFELKIDYEFGFCSSGLPVYETTHMDKIKRPSSTAITHVPIKN